MFSIVSMQDVLINLDGGDDLFKVFEGPRSKNHHRISKGTKETKPALFSVQQVWVLPSHILILTLDYKKLIAYDQVPRLLVNKEQADLLSVCEDGGGGVVDIFCMYRDHEYVLVLLRNGEILVWSFLKPQYKWNYVCKLSLSKCRNCQVVSYVFDEEKNVLIWCEKRGSAYFYVLSVVITISDSSPSQVELRECKTILHNSLPMHIHLVPDGCCLIPAANKPPGLMLFLSQDNELITVHLWNNGFDSRHIPTTSSDFQSIITMCVSLWMNSSSSEAKTISVATHPSTKQMVVLQSDLQVYLVGGHKNNECREVVYLCTLEVDLEHEIFAKEVIQIAPFQRLLIVLMSDGLINVFEILGGLFLWKTDTFRNNAPQIWIRKGAVPSIGVWNKSGIWNLRPKPVAQQIKSVQQEKILNDIEQSEKSVVSDVELSADTLSGQAMKKQVRKIKQGVNRSSEIPPHHLFEILAQWQLSNLSTDFAINVATHIKDILRDENSEEEVNMDEMKTVIDEINDPVLLVVLFSDKVLPYGIRKKLLHSLEMMLELDAMKYVDSDLLVILQQYFSLGKEIDRCYGNNNSCFGNNVAMDTRNNGLTDAASMNQEMKRLTASLLSEHVNNSTMMECTLHQLDTKYFMALLLSTIFSHSSCILQGSYFDLRDIQPVEGLKLTFWKLLLDKQESDWFRQLVVQLWVHAPILLTSFVEEAKTVISSSLVEETSIIKSIEQLCDRIIQLIWIPQKNNGNVASEIKPEDRTRIYCRILQQSNAQEKDELTYEIFLENHLIDEAKEILDKHANSSLKHYSLFSKMMDYLLATKTVGDHADTLKFLIPDKFNFPEVYKAFIFSKSSCHSGQIFKASDKDLTLGMLRGLVEETLKQE